MEDNKNVIVSVFCSAYNHAEFIHETINGFLSQKVTFPVEFIIHDDASNDKTPEIIRQYEREYPGRIRVICQKENQLKHDYAFLLKEMKRACKGEYIALCDGDDYWTDPYKLQNQIQLLEAEGDRAFGCFHPLRKHITRHANDIWFDQQFDLSKRKYYLEDLLKPWFIGTSSLVFRNKDVVLQDWIAGAPSIDIAFILSSIRDKYLICYPTVASTWRIHDDGVSATHMGIKKVMDMALLYDHINKLYDGKYQAQIHKALELEVMRHVCYERERDLLEQVKRGGVLSARRHLGAILNKISRKLGL